MKMLMLDTSGPVCGIAVGDMGGLIYEAELRHARTHSQNILPMINGAMEQLQMSLEDMDVFGAVTGPGSFTGIRIGVSTAKAFAHAQNKPCFGVDALESLSANVSFFNGLICPILDARAHQVYTALFRPGETPVRLKENASVKIDELTAQLEEYEEEILFVGDGVDVNSEFLRNKMGSRAVMAPLQNRFLRAGTACMLALMKIGGGVKMSDYLNLMPDYLKPSQAERERAAKENHNAD